MGQNTYESVNVDLQYIFILLVFDEQRPVCAENFCTDICNDICFEVY